MNYLCVVNLFNWFYVCLIFLGSPSWAAIFSQTSIHFLFRVMATTWLLTSGLIARIVVGESPVGLD